MACVGKVVDIKLSLTSRDYIAGMLGGYVIFVSIYFMILYRINYLDAD